MRLFILAILYSYLSADFLFQVKDKNGTIISEKIVINKEEIRKEKEQLEAIIKEKKEKEKKRKRNTRISKKTKRTIKKSSRNSKKFNNSRI